MNKKLLASLSLSLLLLTGCTEAASDIVTDAANEAVQSVVDDATKEAQQVIEDKTSGLVDQANGLVEQGIGLVEQGIGVVEENVSLGDTIVTNEGRFSAKVEVVTDGDSIKILYDANGDGKDELTAVRILNLDTPEVHGPKAGQKFGPEASEFAKETLEGKTVEIELSANKNPYDKYDRLLAYVFVDGKLYEEMVIEEGLGRVAFVFKPDTKYVDQLEQAEKNAKKNKLGIWSIPNYVQDNGYNMSVVN